MNTNDEPQIVLTQAIENLINCQIPSSSLLRKYSTGSLCSSTSTLSSLTDDDSVPEEINECYLTPRKVRRLAFSWNYSKL